jgi:hypothetical protein
LGFQILADPTKYQRSFSFSGYQATNPTKPLPGPSVDNEYENIELSLNGSIDAIKDVRRSDGALKNGIVTADSLSPSLSIGFTFEGVWTLGETYSTGDGVIHENTFYSARMQNVATALNAPDVDPATWTELFSLDDIVVAGALSMPVFTGSGDGVSTVFNLGFVAISGSNLLVKVGGVIQNVSEYSVNGSQITFFTAPPAGYGIEVRGFATTATAVTVADGSITYAKLDPAVAAEVIGSLQSEDLGVTVQAWSATLAALAPSVAAARNHLGDYATVAGAASGGVVRIPGGQSIVLPATYENIVFEYDGPSVAVNNYQEVGETTRFAKRVLRSQHAGAHSDIEWSTLHIEARPVGSGKNGPTSSDYAMTISNMKKGYGTGAEVLGEIDGLNIVVRQAGPLPSSEATQSDAAGILVNAQILGNPGFICVMEGTTSRLQNISTQTHSMQTQMGVISTNEGGYILDGPVYTVGFSALAIQGDHDVAFLAQEQGGGAVWGKAFQVNKATGTTFEIDMDGRVTIGPAASRFIMRQSGGNVSFLNAAGTIEFAAITQGGHFHSLGNKVVGNRETGWSANTGAILKGSVNGDATVTVSAGYVQAEVQTIRDLGIETRQMASALKAAMLAHGLIGA